MNKHFIRKQICLALSACMLAAGCMAASVLQTSAVGGVKAETSAEAVTMQLMRTEGDVTVSNAKGRAVSIMEKMKLHNGYRTDTEEASYAWINLDDEKLTKMDAVSETEVRKNGKKLEILLKSGKLFFDVEEALTEEETLNIRTSTMTVGIRGTSGWAEVIDSMHSKIYILEGKVECTVSDPVSGEVRSAEISSGETAEFVVYGEETEGKKCDIFVGGYKEEEIGGFILEELAEKSDLCEKIEKASGLKVAEESKKAGERLAADEAKMGAVLANIQAEYMAQVTHVSEEPVWVDGGKVGEQFADASLQDEEQKTADNTPKNGETAAPTKNKTPAENKITPVPIPTVPTETVPEKTEEKKPEQTTWNGGSQSSGGVSSVGNSGGGGSTASGGSTGETVFVRSFVERGNWRLDENGGYIIDSALDDSGEIKLKSGERLWLGAGTKLTLKDLDLVVEQGAQLIVVGTLQIEKTPALATRSNEKGNVINNGTIDVLAKSILTVSGDLYNGSPNDGRNENVKLEVSGDGTACEMQVTVAGRLVNYETADIAVNNNGMLNVQGGLENRGYLSVQSSGKVTGNIYNYENHNRSNDDRGRYGEIWLLAGIIEGEGIFNQGLFPIIRVEGDSRVSKITNESEQGMIDITDQRSSVGEISTKGGGQIIIKKGARINITSTITNNSELSSNRGLYVQLVEEDLNNPLKTWWVQASGSGGVVTPAEGDGAYSTYSEAIGYVNTQLQTYVSSNNP